MRTVYSYSEAVPAFPPTYLEDLLHAMSRGRSTQVDQVVSLHAGQNYSGSRKWKSCVFRLESCFVLHFISDAYMCSVLGRV